MDKLAVVEGLANIQQLLGVCLELGGERVAYYCSPGERDYHASAVKRLTDAGIDVVVGDKSGVAVDSYLITDINQSRSALFKKLSKFSRKEIIVYCHGTDAVFVPSAGQYAIYSSESQMVECCVNRAGVLDGYLRDDEGRAMWVYDGDSGSESAVAGLFHIFEHGQLAGKGERERKDAIREAFGFALDPDLPVVLYYEANWGDHREMNGLLEYLSEHANIIIKPWLDIPRNPAPAGGRIFVCRKKGGINFEVNNLLRFASDCIIAAETSGVFATCVLLGLKVIPVYTRLVDCADFGGYSPKGIHPFWTESNRYVDRETFYEIYPQFPLQLALGKHLPPMGVGGHPEILARLQDQAYWKWYAENIDAIRDQVFGYSDRSNGARNAANLIRDVMRRGTMKPDTPSGGERRAAPEKDRLSETARRCFTDMKDADMPGTKKYVGYIDGVNGFNCHEDKCATVSGGALYVYGWIATDPCSGRLPDDVFIVLSNYRETFVFETRATFRSDLAMAYKRDELLKCGRRARIFAPGLSGRYDVTFAILEDGVVKNCRGTKRDVLFATSGSLKTETSTGNVPG